MSARYFYLQLDLIGSTAEPLSVRQSLQAACGEVFGECGAVLPLDVLSVKETDTGAVALVRVPRSQLVRARAALLLAAPALRVARLAASLQALL